MRDPMLKKFGLGSDAIQYIRARLKEGNHLSQYVLDHVPLGEGSVSTVLPEATSRDALLNFGAGGVTKRRDTEPVIVRAISEYLHAPGRVALFEDKLALCGDASLRRSSRSDFATCDSEVYYFLAGPDTTSESIKKAVRFATSYRFVGVLAPLPIAMIGLRKGAEISLSNLEEIAQKADYLLVGAYDGEGDLVWAREPKA
jgi:hypothetical protein